MADYDALTAELAGDPLTRGYSGMTDQQAVASLNTADRTRNRATMTGSEVLNAINKTEFNALAATDQQRVWDILHLGEIDPFGIEATLITDIFGGGSTTITSLQTLRKDDISRAEEIGFGRDVTAGDVAAVR